MRTFPARSGKYNAIRTEVNGITFDSKKEANRYVELLWLEKAGEVRMLELQPRYPIIVNEYKICDYIADFHYFDEQERSVVEDVKGVRTPAYKLKKKLFLALYPEHSFLET